jgi:hypothetical protein
MTYQGVLTSSSVCFKLNCNASIIKAHIHKENKEVGHRASIMVNRDSSVNISNSDKTSNLTLLIHEQQNVRRPHEHVFL